MPGKPPFSRLWSVPQNPNAFLFLQFNPKRFPEELLQMDCFLLFALSFPYGFFCCRSKADDRGHILGAGPSSALLCAAMDQGSDPRSLPKVQKTDSLGTTNLMCADGQKIHIKCLHVNRDFPISLYRIRVK